MQRSKTEDNWQRDIFGLGSNGTPLYSRHSTSRRYCCHGIFLCNRP